MYGKRANVERQDWFEATNAGRDQEERVLDGLKRPGQARWRPILLTDGGLGTVLEDDYRITFSAKESPTWSSHLLISSPDTLSKAQKSYADAGADIVLTATYQASVDGFSSTHRCDSAARTKEHGPCYSAEEAEEFMRSAIPLARSAFGSRNGLVALSLGAYGATMIPSTEYTGRYPPEMESSIALGRWHAQRLMVFEGHKHTWDDIDLVAFETLPRVDEIDSIRRAMALLSRQKPFWISCVFPSDDERLPDGSEVANVVRNMLGQAHMGTGQMTCSPLPMGVGINCTKIQKLRSLIKKFENAAAFLRMPLPHLVIYPDGANDSTYDTASQKWVPQKNAAIVRDWDEEMFDILQEVQRRDKWAGIIVGGCCKTKPPNIARLRKRIDQQKE